MYINKLFPDDFLRELLPDDFSRDLLLGCMIVLENHSNPVRLNLFAAGVRELFTHILHTFAPDEEVKKCKWFVQDKGTNSITRMQRAIYATQGGFSDNYISGLSVNVKDLHKAAIKTIEALNKATHVKPKTVMRDQDEIDFFVSDTLDALEGLLLSFSEGKNAVKRALENSVYDSMITELLSQNFNSISELAGKGYWVEQDVYENEVVLEKITSEKVIVKFSGIAPVVLQYGSRDDSAEIPHDFPFWMKFEATVDEPKKLKLIDHFFDDSSWHS